jgi:hypothetical protein
MVEVLYAPVVKAALAMLSVEFALMRTSPEGVPPPDDALTVPLSVMGVPCLKVVCERFKVVVERSVLRTPHELMRFAASTEPRPVARSYPTVAAWPSVKL